jgi:hypothetical protein
MRGTKNLKFVFHIVSYIIIRIKFPLKPPQIIQISITQHF